jgi:hypothetical protein
MILPVLAAACSSATSGHAPGVAGGETPIAGLTTYPLAYVKRPLPTADIDARDLITSTPGGDLYVRDQASAGGVETNVTMAITKGMGDVKDLDVSMDGKLLVFSLRLPLLKNATAAQQPTWKIYQYDALAKTVTQLTTDDVTRGHDIAPHFLRDGRIVFASTRQSTTQAVLLDEGRPQYAAQTDVAADTQGNKQPIFELHVMNADGSNIHQISFNTDHDFAPAVLASGQIVFSRWEIVNGASQISLYHANPDGTGLELYYGANSHATGAHSNGDGTISDTNIIQFLNARERSDGTLVAIVRPFVGTQLGGDIVSIDAQHFVEHDQATLAAAGSPEPAQSSATVLGATTDANKPSPGGRFASVYPLYDGTNRLLVSWSPCLVLNAAGASTVCTSANSVGANVKIAPPQYTIWIYDPASSTLSPVLAAESGLMIVDPVILQARNPLPQNIADSMPEGSALTLADQGLGTLIIRSAYDFDGVDTAIPDIAAVADPKQTTAAQRPYRFVRIFKPVEIPDDTVRNIAFGSYVPPGIVGMREILEYAPVQPDGSIQIQVPANVPFTIDVMDDVLDHNVRRAANLPLHTSWMQVMPGETRTCNGCHIANKPGSLTPSHGRTGLTATVNPYALDTIGVPAQYPDTLAALSPREAGETMAATLARISCQAAANCSEIPSPNVIYTDLWTDPQAAGRGPFPAVSFLYSDLLTTAPINANCLPTWSAQCRMTIEYPLHIQPLWTLPRQTVVGGVVTADHTCVLCHNPKDAAGAAQLPPDNLDLTASTSSDDPNVVTSYRQLLFPRNQQELTMGALQPVLVPAPGPVDPVTGQPTTIMVPAPQLAPPMVAGSAAASSTFLRLFDGSYQDPVLDHTGFLSPAELRLISEWLDIGAQYYNDPFVAPAI